jgi:hypothetical protein
MHNKTRPSGLLPLTELINQGRLTKGSFLEISLNAFCLGDHRAFAGVHNQFILFAGIDLSKRSHTIDY